MVKEIRLKEFPTHVDCSDNKSAVNKKIKINNQKIYNGELNRFARSIAVKNLHEYVMSQIPKDFIIKSYPIGIEYIIRTVKNHGNIAFRKKTQDTIWVKKDDNYIPKWDIDNLAFLWIKVINDALVQKGVLLDDTVVYVQKGTYKIEFVDKLKDREIIIKFTDI